MATSMKIFNDPVYGFVKVPDGIIQDLINHPYFQRLSRIKQVGTVSYVYPGATHTRFHHAIGAYHLITEALDTLRAKGVIITEEESEAVSIAILLHDVGHGPLSHALEGILVDAHHESLTKLFMDVLNQEFNGRLSLAIKIFQNKHPKKFLHQLVSSQLDMDRLDYLNRDSFYTGVSEGIIGYDRIIKMLDVRNNEIVVEEKGIYSIEHFLISRRIMYWQVYLHKTTLAAELMFIQLLKRLKEQILLQKYAVHNNLTFFLSRSFTIEDLKADASLLNRFALLDDHDIQYELKLLMTSEDTVLRTLSTGLVNRKLFKLKYRTSATLPEKQLEIKAGLEEHYGSALLPYFYCTGQEKNVAYNKHNEIKILSKSGRVSNVSENKELEIKSKTITKYYSCYLKLE